MLIIVGGEILNSGPFERVSVILCVLVLRATDMEVVYALLF